MNEKDFLQGYELRNWEFSPRIYKIIGAATMFNLLGLFIFAQTNLISTSACESPFVKNVCNVLDTVYVGSKLFGTDSEYVDKIYTPTEIQEADVVWVDSTNVQPQIEYPAGYFQIANRDEIAAREALLNPDNTYANNPATVPPFNPTPFPTAPKSSTRQPTSPVYRPKKSRKSPSDGLVNSKQELAKRNKNVIKGEINTDLSDVGGNAPDKNTTAKNNNDENKENNPIAKNTAIDSDSVKEVEINKKPLQDFADNIVVKWDKKEIDLSSQFKLVMKGRLTPEGTFDPNPELTGFVSQEGDEKMVNVAKSALEAIGDSRWLGYLRNQGIKDLQITLVQNEDNLIARVESVAKTKNEAKTLASGLNGLISWAKFLKLGEDETKLLNAAKAPRAEDKVVILDIVLKKAEAREMMDRKLKEALAKKQEKERANKPPNQPNGTAKNYDLNANSGK
jgi:hypothetical protein